MKLFFVIFFATAATFNLHGQVPREFSYWFYNLPISENPDKVFDIVSKDKRFVSKSAIDTLDTYYFRGRTYWGRIVELNLPDSLTKVDSSSIELTWGVKSNIGQSKSPKTYSGYFKILRLEYFTNDSVVIRTLFDIVDRQLSKDFVHKGWIESGSKETTSFGTGIEITYVDNKKRLQKLIVLRNTYLDQTKSLSLEFNVDQH